MYTTYVINFKKETDRLINAMHNSPVYKFALSTSLIIQRKEKGNSDFTFGILS
jgi:hypothetical protein